MTSQPTQTLSYMASMLLGLWLAVATPISLAQSNPFESSTFDQNSVTHQQDFLPVEEAYQLYATAANSELQLEWLLAPGYYLYQERFAAELTNPQDGTRQKLALTFEPGKTKYDEYFEKDVTVYYERTLTPASWPEGFDNRLPYLLKVTSQGCADAGLCYPPYHHYFEYSPTGETFSPIDKATYQQRLGQSASTNTLQQPTVAAKKTFVFSQWLLVLLLAIGGGTILNLMPCVFPVLSIKALKLASASEKPHTQHLHGWAYTLGTIATFLLVAAVMLAIRSAGAAVGWGFQLQSPLVVSLLAYLFFLMGLSFSGFIQLGSQLMGVGQAATHGESYRASFFTGALAAVVASPCTAPMMGTALGYAVTQPAIVALSIFAALGFGMALPFLALSYIPALSRVLPAPGPWMNTLKQAMAFPLYLTAIWLLWVLGRQTTTNGLALVASGFVLIALALATTGEKQGVERNTACTGHHCHNGDRRHHPHRTSPSQRPCPNRRRMAALSGRHA